MTNTPSESIAGGEGSKPAPTPQKRISPKDIPLRVSQEGNPTKGEGCPLSLKSTTRSELSGTRIVTLDRELKEIITRIKRIYAKTPLDALGKRFFNPASKAALEANRAREREIKDLLGWKTGTNPDTGHDDPHDLGFPPQRPDRSIGALNEGKAQNYAGIKMRGVGGKNPKPNPRNDCMCDRPVGQDLPEEVVGRRAAEHADERTESTKPAANTPPKPESDFYSLEEVRAREQLVKQTREQIATIPPPK